MTTFIYALIIKSIIFKIWKKTNGFQSLDTTNGLKFLKFLLNVYKVIG